MELDILQNFQKYVFSEPYIGWLVRGVENTLVISMITAFSGFVLGCLIAFFRNSDKILSRTFGRIYINLFRNMPIVPMLLLLTIALPGIFKEITGCQFPRDTEYIVFIAVISLNTSSYIAEILRSGLRAIPNDMLNCAKTLGMSSMQIKRKIVLPQVVNICMPSLRNRFVHNLQNTAFAVVIPVPLSLMDVVGQAKRIEAQNFATVSPFLFAAAAYLLLAVSLSFLLRGVYKFYRQSHGGGG